MRLIFFIFSIVVLLLVAAVIGPNFIDWNKHKPKIIELVNDATGLEVKIDGNLSLSLLPSPRVKVEGLTVFAPDSKIKFDKLLSMKSAEVSVALMPLFQKKIEVKSIRLIEPNIQIEIMPDGTPSWESDKVSKAKEALDNVPEHLRDEVEEGVRQALSDKTSSALDSISLDKLEIKNGQLSFIDHRSKASYAVSKINVVLKADSLKGPFDVEGDVHYEGKKITLNATTGKFPKEGEALSVKVDIAIPEAKSNVTFNGVVAVSAPYDVQGQTNVMVQSPVKLAALFGADLGSQYNQPFALNGLLSADEDKASYNDLKISFGDFIGSGKLSLQNLKSKNPLSVIGDIKSSSVFDVDPFLSGTKKMPASGGQKLKSIATSAAAGPSSLMPQTLTLPMSVDIDFKVDVAGLKVKGQKIKGLFIDVKKTGAKLQTYFKVLSLPGQGKVDGKLNIAYTSSSKSPKTDQVVYSDPVVSYSVNGQIGQLREFLNAFVPDADTDAVTKLYKTAHFNLKGAVRSDAISLQDSTLKLDQMVIGLGGRYQPASFGTRAKAIIDISAGSVDFDQIMEAKGIKNISSASSSSNKGSAKKSASPLQGFSLPLDLVFDVSLQKARINNANLEGLRLTGDLIGKKLNLKNASVNNFAGAVISLKGQVDDLQNISGLNLKFYTKTNDVKRLAKALKVDVSTLPKGLKSVEVNASGQGTLERLVFTSNIKALGGQLDASGNASNLLGTPAFSNLEIGIKHSNLSQALQAILPDFKDSAALRKPIDFYTKATVNGKIYDLSGMKVTFGPTSFGGDLKIDAGGKIAKVRGNIKAGNIALDSLLGAKTASNKSEKSSGSNKKSSSGRWSKAPIDLKWMNGVDVNVALAASSITYGGWNLTNPSTELKIANGVLDIKDVSVGVFGGQAKMTTQVKSNPVSLSVVSTMTNIDLEKLVKALSGSGKLKSAGKVSFNMNVNSTGSSAYALINALNGTATLNGTNVILKGFDLAKMARGLATEEKLATTLTSLVSGVTSGGQTKFNTIKGDYPIAKGVVKIRSMVMDGDDAVISSSGYVDLPKWFINVDNKITLKSVPDLKPFEVKIKGPLDNPTDTFGKHILEDYISQKLKRKLAKELPNLLGSDVTDKLKKFGILPQDKTPSQAPANDNTGSTTPQQPALSPLDQILRNPKGAEDALKGVLDGLF